MKDKDARKWIIGNSDQINDLALSMADVLDELEGLKVFRANIASTLRELIERVERIDPCLSKAEVDAVMDVRQVREEDVKGVV